LGPPVLACERFNLKLASVTRMVVLNVLELVRLP